MGIKLKNECGKNLYEYWGNCIIEFFNVDLNVNGQDKSVVNLVFKEYFFVVKFKVFVGKFYQIDFKEYWDGKYKIIVFYVKKVCGMMVCYVVKNWIIVLEGFKVFDMDGYIFNVEFFKDQYFVFICES